MKNIIIKQVDYLRSIYKEDTARNIIKTKIENCRYLLTRFRNTRKNSFAGERIFFHQNMLNRQISSLKNIPTHHLMIVEAQAGRHYWESLKIICRQENTWSRTYPHAKDPFNTALNVGYTFLNRFCRNVLDKSGLHASLGVLHSPNHIHSLVYDFMEIWRQLVVDSVIIPLFSRGKVLVKPAIIISKIQEGLEFKYKYDGKLLRLSRIIEREAYKLKAAIEHEGVWKPFRIPWGNSRTIKKPIQRRTGNYQSITQ